MTSSGIANFVSAELGEVNGCAAAVLRPPLAVCAYIGATHARAPTNVRRTIHRLDRANKVVSCAVFFFKPR